MNSTLTLSTDGSLSYDGTRPRPEEYKVLTQSNSPTIEFATEGGNTIVCRKRVDKREISAKETRTLLQQVVDSRGAPMIVVAHRLRGLAVVLGELNLSAECTHVGNCALSLVRATVPRSPELQLEYAEKEALICSIVSLPTNRPHALPIGCHSARKWPQGMIPSQTKVTTTYSRSRRTLVVVLCGAP